MIWMAQNSSTSKKWTYQKYGLILPMVADCFFRVHKAISWAMGFFNRIPHPPHVFGLIQRFRVFNNAACDSTSWDTWMKFGKQLHHYPGNLRATFPPKKILNTTISHYPILKKAYISPQFLGGKDREGSIIQPFGKFGESIILARHLPLHLSQPAESHDPVR